MSDIELNEADQYILTALTEGRVSAAYLAKKSEWSRNYLTQRLRRLDEHGIVENLEEVGLYEVIKEHNSNSI